jgi:LysR substrate binding domain-containing protein
VEVIDLFRDPVRVLLPAGHRPAGAPAVRLADLAGETWIRRHAGSAVRLVDRVLAGAGLAPRLLPAGRGDEPVEARVFVAAGARRIQAAIMRDQRSPAARALLEVLCELGPRHTMRGAR